MRKEHQIRGLRRAYSKPPTVRGDLCLATAHSCLKGGRGPVILDLQVFQESVPESVCVSFYTFHQLHDTLGWGLEWS